MVGWNSQNPLVDEDGIIDENNPLAVRENSFVSDENSSAETLNAGIVFTGEWEEILQFSVILVTVRSDVASATDGLEVQYNEDIVKYPDTPIDSDVFTVPGGSGKTYTFQPVGKYFRIVYTNGGTNQGVMRLHTQLKSDYVKPSSHRIQDSIIDEDDAELVKSVLTGLSPDGTFKNVKTTEDGNLTISDNSSGRAIALGNVTGISNIHKYGRTGLLSQNVETDVWDYSGTEEIYTFSTTDDIDTISSSNAADTHNIEIQGLDVNFHLVIQTKALNGQNKVTLDTPLIRVFRLKNAGSTNLLGDVYCYVDGAITLGIPNVTTTVRAYIQTIGLSRPSNQTLMAIYTIPDESLRVGLQTKWFCTLAGKTNAVVIVNLYARPFGGVFQLKESISINAAGNSGFEYRYETPLPYDPKTDFLVTADSSVNSAIVSAGFDFDLVDN